MVLWIYDAAVNPNAPWREHSVVTEMELDEGEESILFLFENDYGLGPRMFKLRLDKGGFMGMAEAMIQLDREAATAAFSSALHKAYPLED